MSGFENHQTSSDLGELDQLFGGIVSTADLELESPWASDVNLVSRGAREPENVLFQALSTMQPISNLSQLSHQADQSNQILNQQFVAFDKLFSGNAPDYLSLMDVINIPNGNDLKKHKALDWMDLAQIPHTIPSPLLNTFNLSASPLIPDLSLGDNNHNHINDSINNNNNNNINNNNNNNNINNNNNVNNNNNIDMLHNQIRHPNNLDHINLDVINNSSLQSLSPATNPTPNSPSSLSSNRSEADQYQNIASPFEFQPSLSPPQPQSQPLSLQDQLLAQSRGRKRTRTAEQEFYEQQLAQLQQQQQQQQQQTIPRSATTKALKAEPTDDPAQLNHHFSASAIVAHVKETVARAQYEEDLKRGRPELQREKRAAMNDQFRELYFVCHPEASPDTILGRGDRDTTSKQAILHTAGERITHLRERMRQLEQLRQDQLRGKSFSMNDSVRELLNISIKELARQEQKTKRKRRDQKRARTDNNTNTNQVAPPSATIPSTISANTPPTTTTVTATNTTVATSQLRTKLATSTTASTTIMSPQPDGNMHCNHDAAFMSSSIPLCVCTTTGEIIRFNPHFASMLGRSVERLQASVARQETLMTWLPFLSNHFQVLLKENHAVTTSVRGSIATGPDGESILNITSWLSRPAGSDQVLVQNIFFSSKHEAAIC